MKVRYRRRALLRRATSWPFEPEFCCDLMRAAWDASIIAMDETPAVVASRDHGDERAWRFRISPSSLVNADRCRSSSTSLCRP